MKNVIGILMLAAVVLVAGTASADYTCGFEDPPFTAGSTVNAVDNWAQVNGWYSDMTAETTQKRSGSMSLELDTHNNTGGSKATNVQRDITSMTGTVTYTYYYYIATSATRTDFIGTFYGPNGATIGNVEAEDWGGCQSQGSNLTINGSTVYYDLGSWNEVKIVLNLSADTFKVSINGNLCDETLNFSNSVNSLDRIKFGIYENDDHVVYVDDVSVVPEPATMTLLLLGLPFALRRRRCA